MTLFLIWADQKSKCFLICIKIHILNNFKYVIYPSLYTQVSLRLAQTFAARLFFIDLSWLFGFLTRDDCDLYLTSLSSKYIFCAFLLRLKKWSWVFRLFTLLLIRDYPGSYLTKLSLRNIFKFNQFQGRKVFFLYFSLIQYTCA